ncbi:MAG: transglutaminase family protein [Planctomycetaceae bacterium]|jgi:transglutaminase-like putative cysteine protease|nr:transglutaminase family protein [Planctomycetaceae bacterium]
MSKITLGLIIFCVLTSVAQAQFRFTPTDENSGGDLTIIPDEQPTSKYGPKRGIKLEQTWVAGIVIEAGVQLEDVTITMPVPTSWFEQEVKTYRYVKGKNAIPRGVNFRTINNGAKEAVINLANLRTTNKLEIILEFDTVNYEVEPPEKTDIFVIPKRVSKEVAPYLKASPKIEIDDSKVSSVLRKVLREITNDKQSDWEKVEAIYKYVQKRVKYNDANRAMPAQGVKALLAMSEDKCEGDCKDLCSLFVAMCRLRKVPARLVRLPEHCYAEFYLEVGKVPEQAANTESAAANNLTAKITEKATDNTADKTSTSKNNTPKPIAKKIPNEPRGFWFPCQVAGTYSFGEMHDRQIILQKGDSFPDPENQPNGKKQFLTEMFEGSLIQGSPKPRFRFISDLKKVE